MSRPCGTAATRRTRFSRSRSARRWVRGWRGSSVGSPPWETTDAAASRRARAPAARAADPHHRGSAGRAAGTGCRAHGVILYRPVREYVLHLVANDVEWAIGTVSWVERAI